MPQFIKVKKCGMNDTEWINIDLIISMSYRMEGNRHDIIVSTCDSKYTIVNEQDNIKSFEELYGTWCAMIRNAGTTNAGGCFLTTACIKKQMTEFDDKCHELETLRWFRDHHVKQADIEHYYSVAPKIVDVLDHHPESDQIYKTIYDSVISVCVKAIENKEYEFAYSTYMNAVKKLEAEYLK